MRETAKQDRGDSSVGCCNREVLLVDEAGVCTGRSTALPLSSEYATYKTVKARSWPCGLGFQVKVLVTLLSCSIFAREWQQSVRCRFSPLESRGAPPAKRKPCDPLPCPCLEACDPPSYSCLEEPWSVPKSTTVGSSPRNGGFSRCLRGVRVWAGVSGFWFRVRARGRPRKVGRGAV